MVNSGFIVVESWFYNDRNFTKTIERSSIIGNGGNGGHVGMLMEENGGKTMLPSVR